MKSATKTANKPVITIRHGIQKTERKVMPNLSLKGPDIKRRLENRSLSTGSGKGQYSTDPEITETLKMSKADLHRAAIENSGKINSLTNQIKNHVRRNNPKPSTGSDQTGGTNPNTV